MVKTLDGMLVSVDPALLHRSDAVRILDAASAVEQRAVSLKTLVASRAAEAGEWRRLGYRSPELAQKTGTGYFQAAGTLKASEALPELPALDGAVRGGELSSSKLHEVAGAATPENEKRLLDASKRQSVRELKKTCSKEKAAGRSAERESARAERIPRERYHRSWTDDDGAYRYEGKTTPAVGARMEAAVAGESGLCEATGTGAVPVEEAIGAILAGAFTKVVAHDGVDISKVAHVGRHLPAELRTAILERDGYTCVRPGCGATSHLEVHHYKVDFAKGGATAYWNVCATCPFDHDLLTYGGHRLEGGPGNWTWIPPP